MITDSGIDNETKAKLEEFGIDVVVAGKGWFLFINGYVSVVKELILLVLMIVISYRFRGWFLDKKYFKNFQKPDI